MVIKLREINKIFEESNRKIIVMINLIANRMKQGNSFRKRRK